MGEHERMLMEKQIEFLQAEVQRLREENEAQARMIEVLKDEITY